ncbi:MAG: 23S rRNA (pseudouridine(1915)-N(3))-methyltransferase RlmH [Acidobacteria bacterium]|nr:23S rRNA (pseudouridine(1915)-N(3))-methyltransferase RlmH [Acidobacteriota bacterium]
MLWVGRPKSEPHEAALCKKYESRIARMVKFEETALKPLAQQPSDCDREGERILQKVSDGEYLVVLDERGREMSSRQWADWLVTKQEESRDVTFVIGGAYGVSHAIRERANDMISLTRMTLPHGLARLLLVEQIYRGLCITVNHPYHHE